MGINSGNLSYSDSIQNHYFVSDLYSNILDKLKSIDVDLNDVKRTDLSSVDEFHVRGLEVSKELAQDITCLLYTSPSPRDATLSRMPSSA